MRDGGLETREGVGVPRGADVFSATPGDENGIVFSLQKSTRGFRGGHCFQCIW